MDVSVLVKAFVKEIAEAMKEPLQEIARRSLSEARSYRYPRLIPVTEWNKYHAWPKIAHLRKLILFADTNDFEEVLVRVGQGQRKSVLIDEEKFFKWVEKQNLNKE